ncbi:MAG: hypothetical protein F6K31_28815 [Symploca sp. SIO2G7]|nr:hypothetical protein [Symploca sp. SIO2G7]
MFEKWIWYQFPILNSQFSIPNSQFPIPNSQFPILNSQCHKTPYALPPELSANLPKD